MSKPASAFSVGRFLLLGFIFASGTVLFAQEATQNAPADNTQVNERDRSKEQPTADQQSESRTDREITQQIRQAIMKDDSLSTYAHNVKVITQNGMVTLKGPVRSEAEKKSVEAKAIAVAGESKVSNQLDVAPKDND